MNEMKHFFNTTSVDTIGECLNGEKLLNASRNEKGNTLLTFESAYEGYSDLLTITPDGSVIGTFICDEEQQPQTVNDTQCAANEIVKMDDLIRYENSAEFHRAYADFLDAAELLAVDGQAVVTLAELARKRAHTFGLDVRFDEHTFTFFIADAATNTVVAPPPMNIPTVEAWLDDYQKEEAEE